MNKNARRAVSAIALTSLAATMVACQSGAPLLRGPGVGPQSPAQFGRLNAGAGQLSPNEAKIEDAVRRGLDHIPGEFIVKMRPGTNEAAAQAAFAQGQMSAANLQTEVFASTPVATYAVVKVAQNGISAMSEGQTLQALQSNPNVLYAEPNRIVKLDIPQEELIKNWKPVNFDGAPNDPQFKDQWHHTNVQSVEAWKQGQGNSDFILSIVDTGVDFNHPDLKAKMLPGYNTVDDNTDVDDGNGHGTHCAGIAAAITNNGVGVAGMAPNVKILPIQVLSKQGSGSYASVAAGIVKAADMGAKVISMSLGGPSSSAVIDDAVQHALAKGAILIAASGNGAHGSDANPVARPSYPAATKGVMAVGATDISDKAARFTQAGPWLSVTAPGVNILATFPTKPSQMPGTNYGAISGTSMATPLVAGLAAAVWSKYPSLNATQLRAHLEATADDMGPAGFDILFGHGRINAARAMATVPGGAPAGVGETVNAARVRR